AVVMPKHALAIQQLAGSFKFGATCPLKPFQKMLGLMALVSLVLQLGPVLRLGPLPYLLKPWVPSHAWHHGRLRISKSSDPLEGLAMDGE
ncbi:hypothetical protein M9458_037589, partial [Cirrhinus mrigala]